MRHLWPNKYLGEDGYQIVEMKTKFGNLRYVGKGIRPPSRRHPTQDDAEDVLTVSSKGTGEEISLHGTLSKALGNKNQPKGTKRSQKKKDKERTNLDFRKSLG